jgi:hypothetical protein
MKAKVVCIGLCLLLFLSLLVLLASEAKAQGALDQATFCTPGDARQCPAVGICTGRVKTCENGRWSEQCTGGVQAAPQEICGNGLDDNCNGLVDECVTLADSAGIILIAGGSVLLVFSLLLMKFIK